jgi:hypothetical protein
VAFGERLVADPVGAQTSAPKTSSGASFANRMRRG